MLPSKLRDKFNEILKRTTDIKIVKGNILFRKNGKSHIEFSDSNKLHSIDITGENFKYTSNDFTWNKTENMIYANFYKNTNDKALLDYQQYYKDGKLDSSVNYYYDENGRLAEKNISYSSKKIDFKSKTNETVSKKVTELKQKFEYSQNEKKITSEFYEFVNLNITKEDTPYRIQTEIETYDKEGKKKISYKIEREDYNVYMETYNNYKSEKIADYSWLYTYSNNGEKSLTYEYNNNKIHENIQFIVNNNQLDYCISHNQYPIIKKDKYNFFAYSKGGNIIIFPINSEQNARAQWLNCTEEQKDFLTSLIKKYDQLNILSN